MWKAKLKVLQGKLATFSKIFQKIPEQHTGKARNPKNYEKLLFTAHKLREMLM